MKTLIAMIALVSSSAFAAPFATQSCYDILKDVRNNTGRLVTNGVVLVDNENQCSSGQHGHILWTKTADFANCPLLTCVDRDFNGSIAN